MHWKLGKVAKQFFSAEVACESYVQPFRDRRRTAEVDLLTQTISATTRQSIELERCSNHLRIRQVSNFDF